MDIKRKAAIGVATLGVVLGAGHLVQGKLGGEQAAAGTARPSAIVQLAATDKSAGTDAAVLPPAEPAGPALQPQAEAPAAPASAAPPAQPLPAAVATASPAPAMAPAPATVAAPAPLAAAPLPLPAAPAFAAADPCDATLAVTPGTGAMLDVTLIAPCSPQARVVLRHGGLAFTALTSVSGSLITRIPALSSDGDVSVRFGNGLRVEAAAPIDLTGVRRVAVQWQAADRFGLNAYENGAAWGGAGHLSAGHADPALADRFAALGDAAVPLPMLAEVYTYPADPAAPVEVTIEAEVTPQTCNRELLGEALESYSGSVSTLDLTLAMPACDAQGDFLVLNNLWSGTTLAAAD